MNKRLEELDIIHKQACNDILNILVHEEFVGESDTWYISSEIDFVQFARSLRNNTENLIWDIIRNNLVPGLTAKQYLPHYNKDEPCQ